MTVWDKVSQKPEGLNKERNSVNDKKVALMLTYKPKLLLSLVCIITCRCNLFQSSRAATAKAWSLLDFNPSSNLDGWFMSHVSFPLFIVITLIKRQLHSHWSTIVALTPLSTTAWCFMPSAGGCSQILQVNWEGRALTIITSISVTRRTSYLY